MPKSRCRCRASISCARSDAPNGPGASRRPRCYTSFSKALPAGRAPYQDRETRPPACLSDRWSGGTKKYQKREGGFPRAVPFGGCFAACGRCFCSIRPAWCGNGNAGYRLCNSLGFSLFNPACLLPATCSIHSTWLSHWDRRAK